MKYAHPLKRLAAYAIDMAVYFTLMLLIAFLAYTLSLPSFLPMVGFWFYGSLLWTRWFYFALCESSSWQATVGKKLLSIKVVSLSGEKISFWQATGRYYSKFLSRLFLMIGFLMPLWTKKKQALHDKISSTVLIETKSR